MHSDVFSVIADPTRRRIVRILAEQTHTVGAVVEKLGMSQPTISKHLKVLRDADVVSVTVEGQRRLYSLNPDVFATVTEWINETVQIARQSNEAHVPVALPGGVTASASDKATAEHAAEKPAEKTSEKSAPKPEVEEPAQKLAPAATAEKADETGSETFVVEAPTPEEIEQTRIQRARAQHLTPSARIYSRPAEQAADSAASEPTVEKDQSVTESAPVEEAVDSTPMRPFTPASYGYDAGVTPAASATPAAPAEAKPVVAQKPVAFPQPAAVVPYGIDPAAVVGGSIQPIAVIPEAVVLEKIAEEKATDEKVSAEKPVAPAESVKEEATRKEFAAEDSAVEKSVIAKNVMDEVAAEEPVKAESVEAESVEEAASPAEATEKAELGKVEPANDETVEGEPAKAEASAEEPEYQTMPAYDSVYRPSTETNSAEVKDNHRGGLFGFLRGRRR